MNLQEVINWHTDDQSRDDTTQKYERAFKILEQTAPTLPKKIRNESEFTQIYALREMCKSAWCFAINTKHSKFDTVNQIETQIDQLVAKYNRRLVVKCPVQKRLLRYLSWPKYFTNIDHTPYLLAAAKLGLLKKQTRNGSTELFTFGLQYSIGDNVFGIDRNGRDYRLYMPAIGRQAIPVTLPDEQTQAFIRDNGDAVAAIPDISHYDHITDIGDGKGLIRAIPFSSTDQHHVYSGQLLQELTPLLDQAQ